jgi:class 3 adenylate cyclase
MVVLCLLAYEAFVRERDGKVKDVFAVTDGIVASLFPSKIRHLIFDQTSADENVDDFTNTATNDATSKPLACYFPEATVLYADIAGFTAWSAVRPPEQVFTLLETLYGSFDRIARRWDVYKIETIGDCYVAVTGLPDPQPFHAAIMLQFAFESLQNMKILVGKLESKLGEGTVNLSMRFGLHSGPVTAGVLRGERSRFQLFGDTVHHAAFMEKSCLPGRIHVSSETAYNLLAAGRESWLSHRSDPVEIEGRGILTTYWANDRAEDASTEVIEFHRDLI